MKKLKKHKLELKRKKAWDEFIAYCDFIDKMSDAYKAGAYKKWEIKQAKIERKILKAKQCQTS